MLVSSWFAQFQVGLDPSWFDVYIIYIYIYKIYSVIPSADVLYTDNRGVLYTQQWNILCHTIWGAFISSILMHCMAETKKKKMKAYQNIHCSDGPS